MVRHDAQGALIVVDRLGQLTLLSERSAPVVVGVGVVRPAAHGLPVVFYRLERLALIGERIAHAELSDGGFGVDGKGMRPELLRVLPDLDLVPGEGSQPEDDTGGKSGKQ